MSGLLTVLFVVVYGAGAWKFWGGFRRTNFSQGKIVLGLAWPILMFNKSYRQNFRKALKG